MENKTSKKTHLTFSDRNRIQGGLANKESFKEIGRKLDKSPSTISKEIKAHMFIKKKGRNYSRYFNDCKYRKVCNMHFICDDLNCIKDTWVIVVNAFIYANHTQKRPVQGERNHPMSVMDVL